MSAARLYVVTCVATVVFLVVYVLPLAGLMPELWYVPLERRWVFGAKPPVLSMDWFGRTLFALAAGAIAAGAAGLLTRGRDAAAPRGPGLWAGLVAVVLAVSAAAYVHHLHDRPLKPEPLPSWYQAR